VTKKFKLLLILKTYIIGLSQFLRTVSKLTILC